MQPVDDVTQFKAVDHAANPAFFTQFMDTSHALRTAQSYKQEIMAQLAPGESAAILDVGCGAGQDTLDLARAVGSRGRIVGLDSSETMLEEARTRAASAQLVIEYVSGDAAQLPFADESFDGCRASRVLGHLHEPARALAEMTRVTRPGARVVVADADFDLTMIDIPDRALTRKVIHAACDQMEHGWLGRQLPRLLRQAGLDNILVQGRIMQLDYAFFQTGLSRDFATRPGGRRSLRRRTRTLLGRSGASGAGATL